MPRVYHIHKQHPAGAIFVGRPGEFGNPFTVSKYGREDAVREHAEWIDGQVALIIRIKQVLRGKDLLCFCAPEGGIEFDATPLICHGQTVGRIANE